MKDQTTGRGSDVKPMADALRAPVADGRLRVWSGDADEQSWFASMPVGGVIPSTPGWEINSWPIVPPGPVT